MFSKDTKEFQKGAITLEPLCWALYLIHLHLIGIMYSKSQ